MSSNPHPTSPTPTPPTEPPSQQQQQQQPQQEHMKTRKIIRVDVPPGHLPQSMPVAAEARIPVEEIRLEPIEEGDLVEVASGLHTAFPAAWWSKNEPPPQRPSSPTRRTRFASRYRPWLQHPHYHAIKAVHTPTNTLVGFAGWHSPSHTSLPEPQGGFTNMFRGSTHERLGLAAPGWEESEGWRGVDVAVFEGELAFYDRVRREEVGGRPHWYLAPFFVKEEFRGRGVGAVLMRWGVERADAEGCECYLEALPNARPVYLRFGFGEPVGRGEVGRDVVLIRPARAEGVVGDAKVGDGEVQV